MIHVETMVLPQRVEVDDYHEFDGIQTVFNRLGLKVKVREIAGTYEGIIYVGYLKDTENAAMVKQIKETWKE